jgi:tryptophanase
LHRELEELTDIAYASARKEFYVRGGFVTIRSDDKLFEEVGSWQVVFEDHSSYGGMGLKEAAMLIDGLKTAFDDNPPFYEVEQIRHSLENLIRREYLSPNLLESWKCMLMRKDSLSKYR